MPYGPIETYSWGTVEVRNNPGWDNGKLYHINAKVSKADLPAWQEQGPQHELLRAAMRAALGVRCKLEIHSEPSKGETFELVVAKGGARLEPTDPANDPRPPGRTETNFRGGGVLVKTVNGKQVNTVYVDLHGGGIMWESRANAPGQVMTYYNATMKDLTDALNHSSGRIPVRDKTGLSGRYDFTIKRVPPLGPDENHVYNFPLEHLGLAVKRGTEQRAALVIDHIERPSPN